MANFGSLPFKEQVAFFKAKVKVPTQQWTDVYGFEHNKSFMVAGAAKAGLVTDFYTSILKAIEDGTTLHEFRKDFDHIVAKHGWSYNGGRSWRTRVIYETNLTQSYNAGREAQFADPDLQALRPYAMYKHGGSLDPREEHLAWDGLVLPINDPWWDTHSPMNGWGCTCYKIALSERDLKRKGLKVSKAPTIEWEDKIVGSRGANPLSVRVPKGIDAGFEYRPGAMDGIKPSRLIVEKVFNVPPIFGSRLIENILSHKTHRKLLNDEISKMVHTVADEKKARGVVKSVGVIPSAVIKKLKTRNIEPQTAVISLRDEDILHAIRDTKQDALPLDFLANIAEHLLTPEAVLLDRTQKTNALIYVYSYGSGANKAKVILKLDYSAKVRNEVTGKKERINLNIIRSGQMFEWNQQIRDGFVQYEVLHGKLK